MALLGMQDVGIAFGGPAVLANARFAIERGERVCLLGRNGAGKSTIMKLLDGSMVPDSGEIVRRLGSLRLVGLASTVACLCCILQFVVLRPLTLENVAPEVLWLSLINATACTVAPVLMVMMAIERIGASMAAQTGMVGPISTILMGVLILGEPFTAWVAAGTVLVLAGIYVVTRSQRPAT